MSQNMARKYFEFIEAPRQDPEKEPVAKRVNEFKEIYKDPDEFCCLFVIDKDFTNFIFIPYPEDLVKDAIPIATDE